MANLEEDMNVEAQLQVAYSTNAELRDQIDVLTEQDDLVAGGAPAHIGREPGGSEEVL